MISDFSVWIIATVVSLAFLAFWFFMNVRLHGEPKAKLRSCRLGFHADITEGDDVSSSSTCIHCGHHEVYNPYIDI